LVAEGQNIRIILNLNVVAFTCILFLYGGLDA